MSEPSVKACTALICNLRGTTPKLSGSAKHSNYRTCKLGICEWLTTDAGRPRKRQSVYVAHKIPAPKYNFWRDIDYSIKASLTLGFKKDATFSEHMYFLILKTLATNNMMGACMVKSGFPLFAAALQTQSTLIDRTIDFSFSLSLSPYSLVKLSITDQSFVSKDLKPRKNYTIGLSI